jgi:hypothetical protein
VSLCAGFGHVVNIRIFCFWLARWRGQNPNIHPQLQKYRQELNIMADWDYVDGGSSIVAPNLLKAAINSVIELGRAENESNQEGGTQTTFVSYQVTGDAEKVFAATLTLPGRLINDLATGDVNVVPRNILSEFLTNYVPGTGTLATAAHLSAGVVKLAKLLTFWERQIASSIVTKTPNQTTVNEDIEASQITINFNIPVKVVVDATTGAIGLNEVDFLYILGT